MANFVVSEKETKGWRSWRRGEGGAVAAPGPQARFDRRLKILGIVSALSLLFPQAAVIAFVSIIGLPLGVALMLAPGVFLVLLVARLLFGRLGLEGRRGAFMALAGALVCLAIPAGISNALLQRRAAEVRSGDLDRLTRPLVADTIAVRRKLRVGRDENPCDDFCQRALLIGTARRVIMFPGADIATAPNAEAEGDAFRLERRASCPAVTLSSGQVLSIEGEGRHTVKSPAPQRLRLAMAGGDCLIRERARLAEADLVLSEGRLQRGVAPIRAGFDPFADTLTVDRLSVHERRGQGFEETFRWTGTLRDELFPILYPAVLMAGGYDSAAGFARLRRRDNIPKGYYERADWSGFLTQTLGFDLALEDGARGASARRSAAREVAPTARAVIEELLDAGQAPDTNRWAIVEDWVYTMYGGRAVDDADAELVIRLLEAPFLPVPDRLYAPAKVLAQTSPNLARRFADAVFARLDAASLPPRPAEDASGVEGWKSLSLAVRALPAEEIRRHTDVLEAVARDPVRREHAWMALPYLWLEGASAVPALTYLIEEAVAGGPRFFSEDRYQQPYIAGLKGLCLLGENGREALPFLAAHLDAEALPLHGSYWKLTATTLARLGASREFLDARLLAAGKPDAEGRLNLAIERARRDPPPCDY
jgi:hypothetical protein